MGLIDWALLGRSGLWISGLAVLLASLSWAIWQGARAGASTGSALAARDVQTGLQLGAVLISAGLLVGANTQPERMLWLLSLMGFAWQTRATASRRRIWPREKTRHGSCEPSALREAAADQLHFVAQWVVRTEPWLVLLLTPVLMFPTQLTPWLAPLLALPWTARRLTDGRFTIRTALDGPILVLVLMLPVSLWASMDLQRSMPKLYGVVLGLAVYYAVVNHVRRPTQALRAGLVLVLLGLGVTGLALAGTDWQATGAIALPPAHRHLPETLSRIGGSLASGFNPNEVAAALTLFIPFTTALLLLGFAQADAVGTVWPLTREAPFVALARKPWLLTGLLALALLLMVGAVTLTQSRSAWLGMGVALALLACFRPRRLWPLALLVPTMIALAWRYLGQPGAMLASLLEARSDGLATSRFDIWQRALYMIRDFPYTGVGLNMFSQTANSLYPFLAAPPERVLRLTHAHNAFLQVAVDLGLPGLVAYLAILVGFGMAWLCTYRHLVAQSLRALSVGLLCSMVAYHVYGLADCITLGAKPGIVIWAMWGLMAALANLHLNDENTDRTRLG
jgi:putative inorganic carbon (HCO3(-)) transporter